MMTQTVHRHADAGLHPVPAVFLAGMLPLFLGAMLSDIAYAQTYEIQWTNFASWLIAGGLVLCGVTIAWAVIGLFVRNRNAAKPWLYIAMLLTTFVVGFVGALIHAKDAWASMPGALVLSVIVTLLSAVAIWLGFSNIRQGKSA